MSGRDHAIRRTRPDVVRVDSSPAGRKLGAAKGVWHLLFGPVPLFAPCGARSSPGPARCGRRHAQRAGRRSGSGGVCPFCRETLEKAAA